MSPTSRLNDRVVIRRVRKRLRAKAFVVGETETGGVRTRMVKDEWSWTRVSANGRKIATAGEGYGDRGYTIRIASEVNPGLALVDENGEPL